MSRRKPQPPADAPTAEVANAAFSAHAQALVAAHTPAHGGARRSASGRLPCPFCGSVALGIVAHAGRPLLISCDDCGATGPVVKPPEPAGDPPAPMEAQVARLGALWDFRHREI